MESLIDHQIDAETQLKDAGAVTSSAAAQVGGSPRVLDFGEGAVQARLAASISAITVDAADQRYDLEIQLGNSEAFDDEIVVAGVIPLGHATATPNSANSAPGLRELGFRNQIEGRTLRFCRLFIRVAGSGTPSIDLEAWAVLRPQHA